MRTTQIKLLTFFRKTTKSSSMDSIRFELEYAIELFRKIRIPANNIVIDKISIDLQLLHCCEIKLTTFILIFTPTLSFTISIPIFSVTAEKAIREDSSVRNGIKFGSIRNPIIHLPTTRSPK